MIAAPDMPTVNEWIVLISQDSARAHDIITHLHARLKDASLLLDPAAHMSIEAYDQAREILTAADSNPVHAAQLPRLVALGRATLAPPPDESEWQTLLHTKPNFARALAFELQKKQAIFGITTPQAIERSLDVYRSLLRCSPQ
jgi:hypothetical protein